MSLKICSWKLVFRASMGPQKYKKTELRLGQVDRSSFWLLSIKRVKKLTMKTRDIWTVERYYAIIIAQNHYVLPWFLVSKSNNNVICLWQELSLTEIKTRYRIILYSNCLYSGGKDYSSSLMKQPIAPCPT